MKLSHIVPLKVHFRKNNLGDPILQYLLQAQRKAIYLILFRGLKETSALRKINSRKKGQQMYFRNYLLFFKAEIPNSTAIELRKKLSTATIQKKRESKTSDLHRRSESSKALQHTLTSTINKFDEKHSSTTAIKHLDSRGSLPQDTLG